MQYAQTTSLVKINELQRRKKVIQGGTSAGKTIAILIILHSIASTYPHTEISIVSESIPHIRRGVLKDYKKLMLAHNNWFDDRFNKSQLKYTYANGSYIEFFGADDESKLRGARRNVLFVNEANNIPFDSYNQLSIRTSDEIFIDFNPTSEFWAHTDLIGDKDVDFIKLTYKDNEALPDTIIDDLESKRLKAATSSYWANWCKVYLDGEIGNLEGVVFSNWQTIDKIPDGAMLLGYGMDFGFTNDPTTLVSCYEFNGKNIWHEELYQTGLLSSDIANHLKSKQISRRSSIYADSASPQIIQELYRYGFNIKGANKGRDSINFGINLLQQDEFLVTSQSTNLIKELRAYTWDKDKTGKKLNKPIDAHNHLIDAMRYLSVMKLTNRKRVRLRV
jgi:phage terminase large subunit